MLWIDKPDNVSLSYDAGNGSWVTLVTPQVFAAGSDERYVVAAQHPGGDRSVTNYFIVGAHEDVVRKGSDVVIGPLTAKEFEAKSAELKLPRFSKLLDSLRYPGPEARFVRSSRRSSPYLP